MDIQRASAAIHPLYFPFDLLHSTNLPKLQAPGSVVCNIAIVSIFVTMELHFSLAEIDQAAQAFWDQAGKYRVFAFHAPMGTGKTTFIAALCKAKGVTSSTSSPTFSLINEYTTAQGEPIYHIDLYRLRDEEEARQAGVEDYLYSGHLCLVEWPEKAPGIFPENTLQVVMETFPETRYLRTFTEA